MFLFFIFFFFFFQKIYIQFNKIKPTIWAIVVDSPFSNLKDLAIETANSFTKLPKFLISALLTFIADSIEKKAHFNIN